MIKENLDRAFDQATSEHSAGEEETQQEGRKIFRPKPVNYAQYITNNNDSAE
jgi:hypothetical protein